MIYMFKITLKRVSSFKKELKKLDLLTDFGMLLMIQKGIRGGICHAIHRYAKASNKYMKDYDKNKESSYVKYWGANNLCGWAMLQKLPVNTFEWIKDTFQFNEEIYRYIMKKVMKDIFSKLMLNTLNIIFT